MNQKELEDSFLLKQFREFYSEVIRQKEKLGLSEKSNTESKPDISAESSTEKEGTHPVHLALMHILEQQVLDSRRSGGEFGVSYYKEAQYVMAALADEIFLHTDWDGRELWKSDLLEFKFFGTHVAGELFFEKLDALLKEQDPAQVELAAVYHLALSLGFRGKYHDKDDGGLIEHYLRQIFAFIFKREQDIADESKQLFQEAYTYTLDKGKGGRLPYLKTWFGIIALIIILYLIASHGVWNYLTSDLVDIVEKIGAI